MVAYTKPIEYDSLLANFKYIYYLYLLLNEQNLHICFYFLINKKKLQLFWQ